MEIWLAGVFAAVAILVLLNLAVPPKKPQAPPGPNQVRCPRCKTINTRTCPNCLNVIPTGTLLCPACRITAASLPCSNCKADLKNV